MAHYNLRLLDPGDIRKIHEASLQILSRIGIRVLSEEARDLLRSVAGVTMDEPSRVATFSEDAVMNALDLAPSTFTIYGRDRELRNDYGVEGFVCQAIPGEAFWVDPVERIRRPPTMEDFDRCVIVADALPNIDLVGAMVQPAEVPVEIRDVVLYAELFKRTRKPVRSWVQNREAGRFVLEMLWAIAGGREALREYPLIDFGFEPVSPLQLPAEPLEIALDFARAGLPITIGPMPQAMSTGPVSLAGDVTLGNAEALAAAVVLQAAAPGIPLILFNGPHIMDPRTMNLVFSSPEQCLMSTMVVELGRYYGIPVGANVGLTDAKIPDAQAGLEKGLTMASAVLAGVDVIGGMGIAGCDQGFSLPQLVIDDEIIGFVRRMARGVTVDAGTLALEVVERVGIAGTFLMDKHTLEHWRDELWIPQLSDRDNWSDWSEKGQKTALDHALDRQEHILAEHTLNWMDEALVEELDGLVAAARQEVSPA